jgi:hypothetical protein
VVTERAYAELLAPTIRDEFLAVLTDERSPSWQRPECSG